MSEIDDDDLNDLRRHGIDNCDDDMWGNLRRHWEEHAAKERPERRKQISPGMLKIFNLVAKLKSKHGWREAVYCPKDGTMFWAWDPLTSLPYKCNYHGEWPSGSWWAYMDGDAWPARPLLFKPIEDKKP